MSVSDAHKRASAKWNASKDNLMIRPSKEEGAAIRAAAAAAGQSNQQYILQAVRERMERSAEGTIRRSVIFDFPEDFVFPQTFKMDICVRCPLWSTNMDDEPCCFLTGDADYPLAPSSIPCPFLGGKETVIYEEV